MESLLLPLLTAIIGGLVGGAVAHYFATRRDIAVKRREVIHSNLLEALDDLDRSNSNRPDAELKRIERVIYRIYVFGDEPLIQMTKKMVDQFVSTNEADTTEIMVALRNRIRSELKLEPLSEGFKYLTILPDLRNPTKASRE
ncbi:MAG: hypothetical protein Q8L54_06300 [Devosia sp.]|nr:hypothetical protein [Devosia sp.]